MSATRPTPVAEGKQPETAGNIPATIAFLQLKAKKDRSAMRKETRNKQIVVAVPKGKDVSRSGATRITTTRAGSNQLTLMMASLIISISF